MTEDDELTPEEKAALGALPGDADLPPALEERVVEALRARSFLASRRSPWPRRVLRSAAAVALFAAGLLAGRETTRPGHSEGSVFLLLLYAGPTGGDEGARVREYGAWASSLRQEGRLVGAERLGSEHRRLGAAQTGVAPRGYFLIRASGMEEALDIARSCPHLRHGGSVTVHPVDPDSRREKTATADASKPLVRVDAERPRIP
jgi:hypothetical protein